MFVGSQPQLMAEYNRWMNEKLYAAAASLSDDQRKADLGAFFKSIHATFEHILHADTLWMKRFRGEPLKAAAPGFAYPEFDALRAVRQERDQELLDWSATLTDDWLKGEYSWTSVAGRVFTSPAFAVVSQIFNHQTHHRGQITTLLMQQGIDPGVTDIPMLPVLQVVG
ncbi:MAG TPA: DinB family protein [Polyangiaceae bacterium]|nr:DinB family protein [Polyangiaceae bacterium]